MSVAFLGMRGTGSWSNDERPQSYREGLLRLFPNGDVPLTATASKGKTIKIEDPVRKYYFKDLALQGGTCSGVYKETALSTQYAVGDSATVGTNVFAKVAEAVADHFRVGHTCLLVDKDDPNKESFGKVVGVEKNGDASYIVVKLRTASAAGYLNACDYIDIIGNSNPEGGTIPDAVNYEARKFENRTQIFRTPLDITRTQRRTRLRIGDIYQEAKREAMLYHGIEMELSTLFSYYSEVTGSNNQDEGTMQGLVPFIRANVPDNCRHFPTDSALSWVAGGMDWFMEQLELVFRYGRTEKTAYVGNLALLGIQKLVMANTLYSIKQGEAAYGIKVTEFTTPWGTLYLRRHPLFSYRTHRQHCMLVHEPENLQYCYIDDTHFKADDGEKKAGQAGYDGTKEEFLTECTYEWHFPETCGWFTGIGQQAA